MDITSVKVTSYGGNRFWLVVVVKGKNEKKRRGSERELMRV